MLLNVASDETKSAKNYASWYEPKEKKIVNGTFLKSRITHHNKLIFLIIDINI